LRIATVTIYFDEPTMKTLRRRDFLRTALLAATAPGIAARPTLANFEPAAKLPMIIDTHQHLWDLTKFKLHWLAESPEVLRRSYVTKDYLEATAGLTVKSIYMEVDVDPAQHVAEADYVIELTASGKNPTTAAVVGGRPADDGFKDYVKALKKRPQIKGVRQVLHGDSTPEGFCLAEAFVRGVKLLGDNGLSFDLCMRPMELGDGVKLVKACPQTRFIVDHCGNADPKAFLKVKGDEKPVHDADTWRHSMEALAKEPNVICKISGIVARVPKEWSAETLAPIVNHCLDKFGPERVVFGSDWPVCLLGAPLRAWVDALAEIIAERPQEQRDSLWHANAKKFYGV
jgi:predicted TIM-barrel fold metal-dependent hydrolase